MPSQEEHDKPENLVEAPGEAEHTARSLQEAADSNATLEGFFSINNERPPADAAGPSADKQDDQTREKGHPVP